MLLVLVALLVGGGYFFLVAQAQAGIPSPAALLVVSAPVEVGRNDSGYAPASSGQSLNAGSSVRTGSGGHATIQFPDGSFLRMSPDTTVTVQAAQLTNSGTLKSATLQQKIGRTLSTVQHLAGGASFQVGGHSVTAEVRGTQFEVLVRADGSNLIKVFEGTVTVRGQTTVTLTAGQQVDTDPNGKLLSSPRPTQPDPADPYPQEARCSKAASADNTSGTTQTSAGERLTTGQSSAVAYDSPGGDLTVALCYQGSLMSLTVTDPNGGSHAKQGSPPLYVHIASAPPGHYTATVRALQVPPEGESFAVSFATNAGCIADNIDTGGVVRETLSNAQLSQALSGAGSNGITIQVQGVSDNSARIYYYSNLGGTEISWTIDFYAATPNLGWVVTQISIRGINLTTQIVSRLTAADQSFSSVPSDFTVDRVYSCIGPGGNMMVIEGHR